MNEKQKKEVDEITIPRIQHKIQAMIGYNSVLIPEFTYGDSRIDILVVDVSKRWIRGFEIKMNRSDFLKDEKHHLYTRFLSTFSFICPEGIITKDEVEKPFGLMYVFENKHSRILEHKWIKKPHNFQKIRNMAWLYTYISVLERELPRIKELDMEILRLKQALAELEKEKSQ